YRHEYAQCITQHVLSEYCVGTKTSPHICMILGQPVIIPNTPTKAAPYKRYIAFHTEYCNMGDVGQYYDRFRKAYGGKARFDAHFMQIVFQVAWTLQAIYMVMPNFRHNDLKPNNVFVHSTSNEYNPASYNVYAMPHEGVVFYVPNLPGISVRIGDFDFASASGVLDNYKVLEYETMMPQLNIGSDQNQRSDLGFFIKWLYARCRPLLSQQLCRYLEDTLYPYGFLKVHRMAKSNAEIPNYGRSFPYHDTRIPTARQLLLESDLFTAYRDPVSSGLVADTYTIQSSPPPAEPLKWPYWATAYAMAAYQRKTPYIVPYMARRTSQALFMRLPQEHQWTWTIHSEPMLHKDIEALSAQLSKLFAKNHLYCPIERAGDMVEATFRHFNWIQSRIGAADALEICFYVAICRALRELHLYTLETSNLYVQEWVHTVMKGRCNEEQFLQVLLQLSWIQKDERQ
ncbi:MAG TPA: hypothetical protein V6D20_14135, partial [Candidatus Obscuribacterales bacterium]